MRRPGDPTDALRAALGPPAGRSLGPQVGLEQEYYLRFGGERRSFAGFLLASRPDDLRLDPGDPNAIRLPSGMALTADEREAEVASPPVPMRRGFVTEIGAWSEHGAMALRGLLPPAVSIEGASTHLSFSIDDSKADSIVELYTRRFAPSLMLLAERPDSHGVMVRPRPGRLELCTEFAGGERLAQVTAFAAASVQACARAVGPGRADELPPAVSGGFRHPHQRAGVEIRRTAFGPDLHTEGRAAVLELAGGGQMTAGAHLRQAWGAIRRHADGLCDRRLLSALDRLAAGPEPLPRAAEAGESATGGRPVRGRRPGEPLTGWGDLRLEPVATTWDFTVYRFGQGARPAFVCVPRHWAETFREAVRERGLARILAGYAGATPSGRRLECYCQTRLPGLWDSLSPAEGLLRPERAPGSAIGGVLGEEPGPSAGAEGRGKRPPAGGPVPTDGPASGGTPPGPGEGRTRPGKVPQIPDIPRRTATGGGVPGGGAPVPPPIPPPVQPGTPPGPGTPAGHKAFPGGGIIERPGHEHEPSPVLRRPAPWWRSVWLVPAALVAGGIALALTLTFAGGFWGGRQSGATDGTPAATAGGPGTARPTAGGGGPTAGGGATATASPASTSTPAGQGTATPAPAGAATPAGASSATPTPTPPPTATPTAPIAATPTATPVPPTATATPTTPPPTATPTTPPVLLSGNRVVTTSVVENLGSHPLLLPSTFTLNFLITRNIAIEPNPVSIQVSGGGLPVMTGSTVVGPAFGPNGGGPLVAQGVGTYAGFPTTYVIVFSISPSGVSGTIAIGGDGALPTGFPLVLAFSGGAPQ